MTKGSNGRAGGFGLWYLIFEIFGAAGGVPASLTLLVTPYDEGDKRSAGAAPSG